MEEGLFHKLVLEALIVHVRVSFRRTSIVVLLRKLASVGLPACFAEGVACIHRFPKQRVTPSFKKLFSRSQEAQISIKNKVALDWERSSELERQGKTLMTSGQTTSEMLRGLTMWSKSVLSTSDYKLTNHF